jgi:hypothetical protein
MKAKLIKVLDQYHLYNGDKVIATTIVGNPMLLPNLSKQNCDEIFGVVDVEEIADRHTFGQRNHEWKAYIAGFNKNAELNKDKVFTLEEVMLAWDAGVMSRSILGMFSGDLYAKHLKEHRDSYRQSLQQPTEIEVTFNPEEKDSDGCLILTKL